MVAYHNLGGGNDGGDDDGDGSGDAVYPHWIERRRTGVGDRKSNG